MLAVVTNTWVPELQDFDSLYTKVATKDIFSHLQAGCTGRHALNLKVVALHFVMQRQEVEGVLASAPCLQV